MYINFTAYVAARASNVSCRLEFVKYFTEMTASASRWFIAATAFYVLVSLRCADVLAQTLDEAVITQLENDCVVLNGGPRMFPTIPGLGANLSSICPAAPPTSSGGSGSMSAAGGGTGTTQTAIAVSQRELTRRRNGEETEEPEGSNLDASKDFGNGFAVFLSGQFETLDRDDTRFEGGYDSDIWRVTLGGDFRFTDWLVAGLGFNYDRWNGNFNSGGNFEVDSYGPLIFASLTPVDGVFIDMGASFAHNAYDRQRQVSFSNTLRMVSATGRALAEYDTEKYSAWILTGYDHAIGRFTIGPRVGLNYSHIEIDSITERGQTGLELIFDADRASSLQSVVGLQASAAISTHFGVLVPQFYADWTHEFSNNQRTMTARFAQDFRANPTKFTFQNDRAERNFFHLGANFSMVLANGVQPYVTFKALLDHAFFNNYVASAGVRLEL